MKYDFDEVVDRRNTNSLKFDFARERNKAEEILPLWVADMDFKVPAQVTEALLKAAQHSIFGYTDVKEEYYEALNNWFSTRFAFSIQQEWLVKTPGIVFAIAMAIKAFSEKGDSILIQKPVYYPFSEVILANERNLVSNPLVYADGTYQIDFDDFERKIADHQVKLFLLCSPHNPVGRVWTENELTTMGNICLKHNCLILSDEIHCDFVNPGNKHRIFGSLNDLFLQNSVICTAPSKTFNLAGLQISNVFIANDTHRRKFEAEILKSGYSQLNSMGLAACQAAYAHGQDWLSQIKQYLSENLTHLRTFLKEKLPQVQLVEPEGTYLVWLDFTELGLPQNKLDDLIENKAKLWLDSGTMFGSEGEGFQRMNIACPLNTLKTALNQLESALSERI